MQVTIPKWELIFKTSKGNLKLFDTMDSVFG